MAATPDGEIRGRISLIQNIRGRLSLTVRHNPYGGPYIVDPSAHNDIVLPTQDKTMVDDVKVNKIRYSETGNLSGGYTVYIAEV